MDVGICSWSWPSSLVTSLTERPRRGSRRIAGLAANRADKQAPLGSEQTSRRVGSALEVGETPPFSLYSPRGTGRRASTHRLGLAGRPSQRMCSSRRPDDGHSSPLAFEG